MALPSRDDLDKRRAIALFDRKYLSGQSGIKIADNVYPLSLLWHAEIDAVKHTPFKRIPQVMYRRDDRAEGLPAFVTEQPRHVFKEKILRVPGFSHSDDFMKECASRISKPKSSSADRKRLTRKACADKVDVGERVRVDSCCVIAKIFSFRIV